MKRYPRPVIVRPVTTGPLPTLTGTHSWQCLLRDGLMRSSPTPPAPGWASTDFNIEALYRYGTAYLLIERIDGRVWVASTVEASKVLPSTSTLLRRLKDQ